MKKILDKESRQFAPRSFPEDGEAPPRKYPSKLQQDYGVAHVARLLNLTPRRVYKLITQGRVRALPGSPIRIPVDEADRLVALHKVKLKRRRERDKLKKEGKSPEAARKAMYRKYGRLPGTTSEEQAQDPLPSWLDR